MKSYIITAICTAIITASLSTVAQEKQSKVESSASSESGTEPIRVNIYKLLANSEQYDSSAVVVSGHIVIRQGCSAIFANPEDAKRFPDRGIWIIFPDGNKEIDRLINDVKNTYGERGFVGVCEGKYTDGWTGHGNMYPGYIYASEIRITGPQ